MSAFITIGDIGFFVAGAALVWFFKDHIQKAILGAEAFSTKLRSKSDAIIAAAKRK